MTHDRAMTFLERQGDRMWCGDARVAGEVCHCGATTGDDFAAIPEIAGIR
jgi:hypothetical protein